MNQEQLVKIIEIVKNTKTNKWYALPFRDTYEEARQDIIDNLRLEFRED